MPPQELGSFQPRQENCVEEKLDRPQPWGQTTSYGEKSQRHTCQRCRPLFLAQQAFLGLGPIEQPAELLYHRKGERKEFYCS